MTDLLFPVERHSWDKISYDRHVCGKCGMVRVHIQDGDKHRNEFFRNGQTWKGSTPECDGRIPDGWVPPRAKPIVYERAS